MRCGRCNSFVPEDSNFCHICGSRIAKKGQSGIAEDAFHTTGHDITTRSSQNTYTLINSHKKSTSLKHIPLLFIIAIVVITSIVIVTATNEPEIKERMSDRISQNSYPAVKEPPNGRILLGTEADNASEITVTASDDEACVVKLKTGLGTTILSFYVRAGNTVTMEVPCNSFYVYFATGKTWYGEEHLFGENTNYSMDENLCDFSEYAYTYTLESVNDGNFEASSINADEFQ